MVFLKNECRFLVIRSKVYVQHRIAEHSKEFNEWLEKVHQSIFVVMKKYG